MKRIICCLAGLFFLTAAFSQKQYFVYLQSESEQPFFVKLNDKVFSSTASGYLIISKLHDSTYTLKLGFPDNKWPEQLFKVSMGARDRGFLVKNLPDRGWGLFDLQTLSIVMAEGNKTTRTEIKDVSPFTEVLSKAANDPSLKERTVAIQPAVVREEVKPKEVTVVPAVKIDPTVKKEDTAVVTKKEEKITEPVAKTDSPAVKQQPPLVEKPKQPDTTASIAKIDTGTKKTESAAVNNGKEIKNTEIVAKTDSAIKEEKQAAVATQEPPEQKPTSKTTIEETVKTSEAEYKPSRVRKRSESSTTEGFGLTFTDEYSDGKRDTIRIVIPNPRKAYAPPKDQSKEDKKFLDITTDSKESTGTKVAADTTAKKTVKVITCTSVAAESDFMKLRRKMAGHNSDDKMITEASKNFKTKCFSVQQLKNLSTLFLNDAGKYKFFETAYTSVLDRENFSSLVSELKDETYISRFKTILR